MLRKLGWGLIGLVILIAAGLAIWEPLLASSVAAPPPARRYDTIIARDRWGVPHVFGRTDPDVAYGIAYAHAEDDFATLQEVLAMTRARLGAITGVDGARTDYTVHLLGARETVARDYDKQPADVRALLDGYATGLNRYAERHPGEVGLARLFPVDGRDVATGFVVRSPFFYGLDGVLGALAGDTPLPADRADDEAPSTTPIGPDPAENGSNGFVVAPKRSADGWTRLVSNAHQPWRGGASWYELVVHSGAGWNFAGATFPGAPFPLLGHNERLGWTNTVDRPDLIDVYKLALDSVGDAYRYDRRWRPLERRRIWLPVKLWGPFVLPVPRTVARAVQGPVIENGHGAFAVRYGGADQMRMVEQYYRLNRARTYAEWDRAMALQGVPGTNFLYADATGRIAHVYNAAFPNRRAGFDYSRVLPGDTSRAYTPGTVPWRMVPKNVNPRSGFLVNANNTPFEAAGPGSELDPKDFSPLLGIERDRTNRGTRAVALMVADPSISQADLERIKYDTGVSRGTWAAGWFEYLMTESADEFTVEAQRLLGRWDWNFDGRGPADALALLLMRAGNRAHHRRQPLPSAYPTLLEAGDYLREHFGRLDPPLGQVLRLRQGKLDLPLDGGPDVLRAMAIWDEAEDGRLAAKHGDSFVMFMAWNRAGRVRSRSIQPFGAATTRPASRHYADQAALFAAHRTKPVRFRPAELRGHVERVYRP